MSRLELLGLSSVRTGVLGTLTASGTTVTWSANPQLPAIAAPDFLDIVMDPETGNEEVIRISAHDPASPLTSTCARNVTSIQNGAGSVAHTNSSWVHGPLPASANMTNPMTSGGDLIYGSGSVLSLANGKYFSSAGGTYSGNPAGPWNVPNSTWTPLVNPGTTEADLGSAQTVTTASINVYDQHSTTTIWQLQYSTNGSAWVDSGLIIIEDGLDYTYTLSPPVTARYWQIVPTNGSGHYGIQKVWLFGPSGAPTRLPVGSPPQVLGVDPVTLLPTWQGDVAWTVVGASGAPAFQNSWANFDGGTVRDATHRSVAFRKLASGLVVLTGFLKSGASGTTAFTLPAGYRPICTLSFSSLSNSQLASITVNADGTVSPSNYVAGSNVNNYASLDGISFFAEQ